MDYERRMISIREAPPEERPRERMSVLGSESLSDHELLSIIIGSGNKDMPVEKISHQVLKKLDETKNKVGYEDLLEIRGLGKAKASLVASVLELGRRYFQGTRKRITYPGDVYPLLQHYADRPQEHFICITLNGAHEVVRTEIVSIGLVNRTIVHPREVFSGPIKDRATAVIVAHNHPSGNLMPSPEDISITKRLREAGKILGIDVLDHVIFSEQGFYSFLEKGKL